MESRTKGNIYLVLFIVQGDESHHLMVIVFPPIVLKNFIGLF
jgi:hypothetical protein